MRPWYDALNPAGIPLDIPANALLGSYVDHPEFPFHLLTDRFPNHKCVTIAAHGGIAQLLDVENGAMTPQDVPVRINQCLAEGIRPWIYATSDNWDLVRAACQAQHVALPEQTWFEANWNHLQTINQGAMGHQFQLVEGPGVNYDQGVVLDFIDGFDKEEDDMADIMTPETFLALLKNTTIKNPSAFPNRTVSILDLLGAAAYGELAYVQLTQVLEPAMAKLKATAATTGGSLTIAQIEAAFAHVLTGTHLTPPTS